ncbi:MAG: hypothetical protein ACYDAN_08990 [Candidatus Limnocylindrales bacterium]
MSRRSRHGRRPQTNMAPQGPESGPVADRPRAATATVPPADEPVVETGSVDPVEDPSVAFVPSSPAAVSSSDRIAPALPAGPGPAAPGTAAPVDGDSPRTTCTQAQLRRFIKSRPWIPMHELRRRFGIYGGDDDVTPVRVAGGTIFVGLPTPEGRMLGELLSSGDVGYELSLDPGAPIVVGVYPMRPVPRG